jgi:hypothetical protein
VSARHVEKNNVTSITSSYLAGNYVTCENGTSTSTLQTDNNGIIALLLDLLDKRCTLR